MLKINIRKLIYNLRWRYLTLNNIVLVIAIVIGANWVWESIEVMQRNYILQRTLDLKQRQQTLAELENTTLGFEQRYYQSDEYKELATRKYLGLAESGEKVLILPPNTPIETEKKTRAGSEEPPSNLRQWMNFLLGSNRRNLQK
jgi:uncharacterized protein YxeA